MLTETETEILASMYQVLSSIQNGDYSKRVYTTYDNTLLNTVGSMLNEHVNNLTINPAMDLKSSSKSIEDFENIIIEFANHNFKPRLPVSEHGTIIDAISEGINMLGNDLQSSYVSQNYFSNIYNAVSEIMIVLDEKGVIENVNKAALGVLGKRRKDLIGRHARILLDKKQQYLENEIIEKLKYGKRSYSFEIMLLNYKGVAFPASCSISRILNNDKKTKGYLFIAKDISDQKNKELNDLKLVINTQEKERQRLAFDLHDSLGQELNAVFLYLNSLSSMTSDSPRFFETLQECRNMMKGAIESVRGISFDLMPRSLDRYGLIVSIRELTSRLQSVCNIKYFPPSREPDIENSSKTIIFRIIQEFINNSLKHSPGSDIKVSMIIKTRKLMIELSDNGKGFDSEATYQGNGLKNMKARLEALQAEYDFISRPLIGTQLRFHINEQ